MEHLFNCHNEWQVILSMIEAVPFLGIWITALKMRFKKKECSHGHV